MARSTARKRALNTLYEADEKGQDILSLLAERLENPGAQTPLPDYAVTIVRGVAEHEHDIDEALNDCSKGWTVPRMPVVDRNILRLAAWEIMYNDEIPEKVAIDEALALAKTLCDDRSPAFIHGVLSAVAKRPVPVHDDEQGAENVEDETLTADAGGNALAEDDVEAVGEAGQAVEGEEQSGDATVRTEGSLDSLNSADFADTADFDGPASADERED